MTWSPDVPRLTPMERRALVTAANGLSCRETGRLYFVAEETIRKQRKWVLTKLGARNMTEAVSIAWRLCILNGDDITGGPIPLVAASHATTS